MDHDRDPFVQDETFGCNSCQYRYHYNDHIAKGAFGTVFEASISTRGGFIGAEQVAVKVIHLNRESELLTDRKKWSKLRHRLQNLPEFSHDHLVKYHKITIAKGSRGGASIELMMDYHTGEDLRTVIRNFGQQRALLSEGEAVSYTIQIAEGLQFLHDKQLIHGDLKPCNILTTQTKNGNRNLAICDLDDIVQMERDGTCSRDITNLRGTYRFMSPEMLRKFVALQESENPGRKTDMWSLGCIILELADCVIGNDQKWLRKEHEKIQVGNKVNDERFVQLIIDGYVPCAIETIPSCLSATSQQCLHTAGSERISASSLIQQLKAKELIMIVRYRGGGDANECFVFDPSMQTATEIALPMDLRNNLAGNILAVSNGSVCYQRKPEAGALSYPYFVEVLVWDVQRQTVPTILFQQGHRLEYMLSPIPVMDKIYFWSSRREFGFLDLRAVTSRILESPPNSRFLWNPYFRARDGNRIIFIGAGLVQTHPPSMGVKCFDTATGEWESLPDLPGWRNGSAMVVLQKIVYVLGGYDEVTESRSRSCLRLDLQSPSPQWETMCDLLRERVDYCAVVSGNKIYAVGGLQQKDDASSVMEMYDTERDLWSAVSVTECSRFFDGEFGMCEAAKITLSWPV